MVFADELDIHLLPKVGCAWTLKGTQVEVTTQAKIKSTIWLGPLISPLGRCATVWERAKPTHCSATCWRS